jgi:hypothetical protein
MEKILIFIKSENLVRREKKMKQKIATIMVGMAFVFMWTGLPILVGLLVETIVL